MTDGQWERVESARLRLRDCLNAGGDPIERTLWQLAGENPSVDEVEPFVAVALGMAELAFFGEWHPRGQLTGILGWIGQWHGLSAAEITACLEHVLNTVEQVAPARPGRGD